jgi:membrane fusion protein, multidrug efflux system
MAGIFGPTSTTDGVSAGVLANGAVGYAAPRTGVGRGGRRDLGSATGRQRTARWRLLGGAAMLLTAGGGAFALQHSGGASRTQAAPPPPIVTVSAPLREDLTPHESFLGQFSAVAAVDLRAQVGGLLTEIHFVDGQIVHKGDLLFVIDPRPYQIKFTEAVAQVQTNQARLALADRELARSRALKHDDYATAETVDQRMNEHQAAQAALDSAVAAVRDAQLDLEYCRVTAPFTGRISSHRVSVGSLISGSRAATSPTTLLTTLVALDPIYLDFDMSEADYLAYKRAHEGGASTISDAVDIALGDENSFSRQGKLDFIDNAVDRGSGTLHARATVPNPDLFLTPGVFARLRLTVGAPHVALLVPDSAVTLDQSNHVVMTVADNGMIVPRQVETGTMQGGLREIRGGIGPSARVVIDGLMRAQPGAKVKTERGAIHATPSSDS